MGAHVHGGTMPGAITPVCNDCMVALCWDISEEDYAAERPFWDSWVCRDCNGGEPMSRKKITAAKPAAKQE
jgi:hypothetical protein